MTDELFKPGDIQKSPSPRISWMMDHNITVAPTPDGTKWVASRRHHTTFGHGETRDDALLDIAKKHGLKLWNEQGI